MSEFILKYKKVMSFVNKFISIFSGLLILILTLMLLMNIIFREIGHPIPGLSSVSIILMIVVIYLGLSRSEEYHEHANIDIVSTVLPQKFKKINYVVIHLINFITILIFFFISIPEFRRSYERHESLPDVITVLVWPAKLAITVGLGLYLIQIILNLIEAIVTKHQSK